MRNGPTEEKERDQAVQQEHVVIGAHVGLARGGLRQLADALRLSQHRIGDDAAERLPLQLQPLLDDTLGRIDTGGDDRGIFALDRKSVV